MVLAEIEVENGDGADLTVTIKGKPEAIINTLVHGLGRDQLIELKEALDAEMAKREK